MIHYRNSIILLVLCLVLVWPLTGCRSKVQEDQTTNIEPSTSQTSTQTSHEEPVGSFLIGADMTSDGMRYKVSGLDGNMIIEGARDLIFDRDMATYFAEYDTKTEAYDENLNLIGTYTSLLEAMQTLSKTPVPFYDQTLDRFGYKVGDKVVVDPIYTQAGNFVGQHAAVAWYDNGYFSALIDLEGQRLKTFENKALLALDNGFYGLSKEEGVWNTFMVSYQIYSPQDMGLTDGFYFDIFNVDGGFFVNKGDLAFFLDEKGQVIEDRDTIRGYQSYRFLGNQVLAHTWVKDFFIRATYDVEGKQLSHDASPDRSYTVDDQVTVTERLFYVDKLTTVSGLEFEIHGNPAGQKALNDQVESLRLKDGQEHLEYSMTFDQQFDFTARGPIYSLLESAYSYALGAAHGSYYTATYHYHRDLNTWFTLGDLMVDDQGLKHLQALADASLIEVYGEDLFDQVILAEDQTFYFTDKGIEIEFQLYELGPYALGMPQVELEYGLIAEFLNDLFPHDLYK